MVDSRVERFGTPEYLEVLRESVVRGIDLALGLVRVRFDRAEEPLERLPYHRENHTRMVVKGTQRILETIARVAPELVGTKEVYLGCFAAGFHDTVQKWQEKEGIRKRTTGANEEKSFNDATFFMRSENEAGKGEVFSKSDVALVKEAILGTIPTFDAGLGTVVQKNVSRDSSPIARAVALADLNTFGLEPEIAVEESRRLFREENLDVFKDVLATDFSRGAIYKTRMITWLKDQVTFTQARQVRLGQELEGFPDQVRVALQELFAGFPQAIENLEKEVELASQEEFPALVARFGYYTEATI